MPAQQAAAGAGVLSQNFSVRPVQWPGSRSNFLVVCHQPPSPRGIPPKSPLLKSKTGLAGAILLAAAREREKEKAKDKHQDADDKDDDSEDDVPTDGTDLLNPLTSYLTGRFRIAGEGRAIRPSLSRRGSRPQSRIGADTRFRRCLTFLSLFVGVQPCLVG